MELENPDDFTALAALVKGFSNDTRLALLVGFYHGYSAKEMAEFLDMTRGGLQNNITKMIDLDLVYRPSSEDAPTYALTPIGEFFAKIFDDYGLALLAATATANNAEEKVRQELRDSPVADSLSDADERKIVHTRKWQQVDERIRNQLRSVDEAQEQPAADRTPSKGYTYTSLMSDEEFDQDEEFNKLIEAKEEETRDDDT